MEPYAPYIGAFSFLYGGKPFAEHNPQRTLNEKDGGLEAVFTLPDGLRVTQTITLYPQFGAAHWLLQYANTGEANSAPLTEIYDCDFNVAFQKPTAPIPGRRVPADTPRLYRTIGSNWARDEFHAYDEPLADGATLRYHNEGGRSSQSLAPFFDINQGAHGMIVAIGWTGQWRANFALREGELSVQTGLEDAAFYLQPGESVRTSSVIVLEYAHGQTAGHNAFRRLVKEHFSLVGQPGRPAQGPLCLSFWGSVPSDKMIDRIEKLQKLDVVPDYFWIDAGWYGHSTGPCPNEFVGDWSRHTGSWCVNETYHPDGLLKVREALRKANLPLLLWVEPERVLRGTDTPNEHPTWFLALDDDNETLLIDYGNEEAWQGTLDMLTDLIARLDIHIYRQDFNVDPLPYWRKTDAPDRRGLTEIKHITGLYRLWDALLKRFPHLLIDNCASGGRRIDIETLSRSIPLWRSDYQCTYDADPETTQVHMMGINWYLPYSGSGAGDVLGDTYRTRSCMGAAMTSMLWYQEYKDLMPTEQEVAWLRARFAEVRRARPFFAEDYYPITRESIDDTAWAIAQFHNPQTDEGMVLAFRRPQSPCPLANVALSGLPAGDYLFEDADTGETVKRRVGPGEMMEISIPDPRGSKLLFYRKA